MSAVEDSPSKCRRKAALSIFFVLELFAYVLSCIALISPSWQYVYLENGRTEHHHGLWLDCKRDYSHDYGRSREYYETLYRLDKQQSPLDQFFLTSLLCVYKFDYYIDAEDLYDHNHDENRLQDDANQHLMLGWKIASLAAFGFAVLTAGAALLLSVCAFCHRTLICAAAVLVSVAALLSSAGLLIFYLWANYQDNNIIKEEDGGIYEQYFGWALYTQIAGTVMYFIASFMGCIVTAIAFKKGRPKLVKIEVVDGDESTLLNRGSSPFKRSFSAIYKVDSAALRRWEKDYMNLVKSESIAEPSNFKRATSVPNFKKYPRKSQYSPSEDKITKSTSNLFTSTDYCNFSTTTETFTPTARAWPPPSSPTPKSILKASSKQQLPSMSDANRRPSDDPDLTYEYLPCDSVNKSQSTETVNKSFTTSAFADADSYDQNKGTLGSRTHPETAINVYDKVYEHITEPTKPGVYEQPNSYRTRNSVTNVGETFTCFEHRLAAGIETGKSTLINDVSHDKLPGSSAITAFESVDNKTVVHQCAEANSLPQEWRSSTDRQQNIPASPYRSIKDHSTLIKPFREFEATSATLNLRDFAVDRKETSCFSTDRSSGVAAGDIAINTFDIGTFATREGQRSIKNLSFQPSENENIEAFERSDSSERSSVDVFAMNKKKKSDSLIKTILSRSNDVEMARGVTSSPYRMYVGDEMDRSVGSSATLENEAMQERSSSQQREAELRLNLFMNGGVTALAAENGDSSSLPQAKDSSITTV